jgi:hypothetical protein
MTSRRPDVPPEAADFLAANPDVRAVELLLPDLNAILRGKRVSRRELAGLYREVFPFRRPDPDGQPRFADRWAWPTAATTVILITSVSPLRDRCPACRGRRRPSVSA